MLPLVLSLFQVGAPPPPPPQPPPPTYAVSDAPPSTTGVEPEKPQTFIARAGLGYGSTLGSDENAALTLEGYNGGRVWVTVDGSLMINELVGVGVWGAYAHRQAQATSGSPTLRESDWFVGAQVPVSIVKTRVIQLLLIARLGRAWATLGFGGTGRTVSGFAYGGEVSVLFPRVHLGTSIGLLSAPTDAPGDAGLKYDAGSFYFALNGVIDG